MNCYFKKRETAKKISVLMLIAMLLNTMALAQIAGRELNAYRTDTPPHIDGSLDEELWQVAEPADQFWQINPYNGKPATQESDVRIAWDDKALYLGGMLYDHNADSILTELSPRDDIRNADYFGIYIDAYADGLVGYGFFVTASGVQIDMKMNGSHEDNDWDAVWESAVSINEKGWFVEMRIPYSALRFPQKDVQQWGLNFFRNIRRNREQTSWSYIDNKIEGVLTQQGHLNGIKGVMPPLRLSFIPYLSAYAEKLASDGWSYSWKGGMDVKYGINESFTLDMILIPDFGQVESDDQIYNLSPFEVYYGEKRPFFQEGTELFDKGNVFYSRRVGKTFYDYGDIEDQLNDNEIIIDHPKEAQLINATKFSGKTQGGLAIGVFNAMTANTYTKVKDTLSEESREIKSSPFSNYNMLVFEQSFKNNSYVSFYNTNVYRDASSYVANVSGTDFLFKTKNKTYGMDGSFILSQKYNKTAKNDFGYKYDIEFGKISGNFLWELSHAIESNTYDPNDMGFLRANNEISYHADLEYNIYDPFWKFLNMSNSFDIGYSSLYKPSNFTSFYLSTRSHVTFLNHLSLGSNIYIRPVDEHDYYESRTPDRKFVVPPGGSFSLWLSPDYRKAFIVDLNTDFFKFFDNTTHGFFVSLRPRWRVSDKFTISHRFEIKRDLSSFGYVRDSLDINDDPVIIFGRRDITDITNTLQSSFIFNNHSSLNLRLRHYWIKGVYDQFYDLNNEGHLEKNDYNALEDFNYNAFNIDMSYSWFFAPGSELSLVWKNAIYTYDENGAELKYFDNVKNTLKNPSDNSFSVKILYYIDYQNLMKGKKARQKNMVAG